MKEGNFFYSGKPFAPLQCPEFEVPCHNGEEMFNRGNFLISRVNKNNIEKSRTIKFHFKMDKITFGGSTLIHLSMGNSY